MPERALVLAELADRVAAVRLDHPVRVAVDGVDAAGKTTLADELAALVEARGRPVIRASVDGFHRPAAERYARGRDSPLGFYRDSFDYPTLRRVLLDPLGPEGDRRYRAAAYDSRRDVPVDTPVRTASRDAVLLFDGIFLARAELAGVWDLWVFLHVDESESRRRGAARDAWFLGDEAPRRYDERYIPGQRLYLAEASPLERADVVLDLSDPSSPQVIRQPGGVVDSPR